MRIEFDAGNAGELEAVAALIASLRGESQLSVIGTMIDTESPIEGVAESLPAPLPPAVAAPVAVIPPAPPPALSQGAPSGVDVDATGLPWDKRIHSTPATKKQNGEWRGKRGLDDATRAAVTAELRAALAAPAPGVPAADPLPSPEPAADAATAFAAPAAAPASNAPPPPPPVADAAPPPAPPVPVAPPAAGAAAPAAEFASLMRKITALQSTGKMSVADSAQISASLGISGVRDLMVRPDLIPSFDALLPTGA